MAKHEYLDDDDVKTLWDATELWAHRDGRAGHRQGIVTQAVVDVALSTGLRVAEIALLKCGDLNAKKKTLTVPRLKRREPVQETLNIDEKFTKRLQTFIEWKAIIGQATGENDALFVGKRGTLTAQGLASMWKKAIVNAKLDPKLTIHKARHTMAYRLLRKTDNIYRVQKQLGHKTVVTTANMYGHISDEQMREGVTGLYDW